MTYWFLGVVVLQSLIQVYLFHTTVSYFRRENGKLQAAALATAAPVAAAAYQFYEPGDGRSPDQVLADTPQAERERPPGLLGLS